MGKKFRTGALLLALCLTWGVLYPQYALTENMYELTGEERNPLPKDCARDFFSILHTEPQNLEIRFALLEKLEAWFDRKEETRERR